MDEDIVDHLSGGRSLNLTLCDIEPIHIPGSIQPHGMLLVIDAATLAILAGAGDTEGRFTDKWMGIASRKR